LVNSTEHIENQATALLKEHWGHDDFRPLQLEVITQILKSKDTIVLFPTGGGKSITFQIPALILPNLSLVITPLIALMDDQVNNLRDKGINAEAIHSGKSFKEVERIIENCRWGGIKMLYLSPERLGNDRFQDQLRQIDISMVAIDEAHCISQWGHDFRPAYLRIGELSEIWSSAVKIALTATATPNVISDIEKYGCLNKPEVFKKSFKRENISLHVHHTQRKHELIKKLLLKMDDVNAIVYIRSRREVQNLSILLSEIGFKTGYYHAGISFAERQKVQNQFMNGELQIICATNAFGMGLDKGNVRQVIHFDVPPSLEEYVQEFGRAGRDGLFSEAHILVNDGDKAYAIRKNLQKFPSFEFCKKVYSSLFNFYRIPIESGEGEVRPFEIKKFCLKTKLPIPQVYHAIQILNKNEYIDTFDQKKRRSTVRITCSTIQIRENQLPNLEGDVLSSLARIYEGILDYSVEINLKSIAHFCDISVKEVGETLSNLNSQGWISYYKEEEGERIYFLKNRLPKDLFHINKRIQKSISDNSKNMLQSMLQYLESDDCRPSIISKYFGETDQFLCRICDNCNPKERFDDESFIQNQLEEGL